VVAHKEMVTAQKLSKTLTRLTTTNKQTTSRKTKITQIMTKAASAIDVTSGVL